MKLVDILARELKVWPDNALADCAALFIAQDSDGMIVTLDPEEKPRATQFRGCGWSRSHWTGIDLTLDVSDDHASAIVTREQWQAAVDALNDPAWNGEGLPPVGLKVEAQYDGNSDWRQVTLKYQSLDFSIFEQADGNEFPLWNPQYAKFRPIRTAEQIEAEERECAVTDMCVLLGKDPNRAGVRVMAGVLYEAGYRKQVAP
ncbi:hypothetical protein AB7M18_003558 [Pseudomonas viridiflava]